MENDKEPKKYVDYEALKYYTERLMDYMREHLGTKEINEKIGMEENEQAE